MTQLVTKLNLSVTSETGCLKTVVIGYPDNFLQVPPEIINETQKKYYFNEQRPTTDQLIDQLNQLVDCLEQHGVTVYRPTPVPGVPDQLMPRDIGITIGDKLLIANMAYQSRQKEWHGIQYLLDQIPEKQIIHIPADIILEGGDLIVDKQYIFVGISQRTTLSATNFLQQQFPDYQVVPVYLKQVTDGEDILHLDCAFVPVGIDMALIYPDGISNLPNEIKENYKLLPIFKAEQEILGSNVLSISPDTVISRQESRRINQLLRKHDLTVIELPFDAPPKTGGSFRCCSLPLWRK